MPLKPRQLIGIVLVCLLICLTVLWVDARRPSLSDLISPTTQEVTISVPPKSNPEVLDLAWLIVLNHKQSGKWLREINNQKTFNYKGQIGVCSSERECALINKRTGEIELIQEEYISQGVLR